MNSTIIERKALNALEDYLEDSVRIDPKISSNDKEMSWDGHLYVYSKEDFAKVDYICRVPIQVKGKSLPSFKMPFSYPIDVADLLAYLTEGVLYFVIQTTPTGKKIFYRELFPLTIKHILNGHRNQKAISVKLHQLDMPVAEFEQNLIRFNRDCKKQVSAVIGNAKPFKMEDLQKLNVQRFTFTAPYQDSPLNLFSYLATHPTYIYGEINDGVEWPIGDGPVTLQFRQFINQPVVVGGRTFFDGFNSEIKDEYLNIDVGGVMKFAFNIQNKQFNTTIHFHQNATTLKGAIKEAEFVLALAEHRQINIGNLNLGVTPNDNGMGEYYKEMLPVWSDLAKALDKIGYAGDLQINHLSDKDSDAITLFIDTMLKGEYHELTGFTTGLVNLEFLGLNLLIWIVRRDDGKCVIGNAFDGTIRLQCKKTDDAVIPATVYSYLSSSERWGICDNIDYGGMISAYDNLPKSDSSIYDMANLDVLEMLKVADKMNAESERRQNLLDAAQRLTKWLAANDQISEHQMAYKLNDIQIRKRKGALLSDDMIELNRCVLDPDVTPFIKAGAALLLDNKELFHMLYSSLSEQDKSFFDKFPINYWR